MFKNLSGLFFAFCLITSYPLPSQAGRVLDRIRETGVITAGTRKDAVPFAYINDKNQWVGYSVDILEAIRQQAETQLGKPIKLKLVEATEVNRFSDIQANTIDVECSSTTFTWERTKQVDFSLSYFTAGTRLLVKKDSDLSSIGSLAGKRIGVLPNSTNEATIKLQQPEAKLVFVKNYNDGVMLLEKGKIDGFAADSIVLTGLKKNSSMGSQLKIVPQNPYKYESYACMLPKDDSDWRNLVNYSLVKFMQGVVNDQTESVKIYERWFGETGVAPFPRNTINQYFEGIVNSYEWVPLYKVP